VTIRNDGDSSINRDQIAAAHTPVDEYGRAEIRLPEEHNRPGKITVDGDMYETGPIATIHFEFDSEPPNYMEAGGGEIDFGTFQVTLIGAGRVRGNATLGPDEVRALCAALMWQIEPEAS
jgi:hypothetical protein